MKQYLPLGKSVVARQAITLSPLIDFDTLRRPGMVNLTNAVSHFAPHTGSPFESCARRRIRRAVIDELRRTDWMPRSMHLKARKIQQAREVLEPRPGRFATDDEVAAHREPDEKESTPHEVVSDPTPEDAPEAAARRERARLIAERLEQLPDLHRKVIALHYYEDLRLRQIAAAAGLCESRIRQVHAQAIQAIKSYLEARAALPVKR